MIINNKMQYGVKVKRRHTHIMNFLHKKKKKKKKKKLLQFCMIT